jgi:hypothetical protein
LIIAVLYAKECKAAPNTIILISELVKRDRRSPENLMSVNSRMAVAIKRLFVELLKSLLRFGLERGKNEGREKPAF